MRKGGGEMASLQTHGRSKRKRNQACTWRLAVAVVLILVAAATLQNADYFFCSGFTPPRTGDLIHRHHCRGGDDISLGSGRRRWHLQSSPIIRPIDTATSSTLDDDDDDDVLHHRNHGAPANADSNKEVSEVLDGRVVLKATAETRVDEEEDEQQQQLAERVASGEQQAKDEEPPSSRQQRFLEAMPGSHKRRQRLAAKTKGEPSLDRLVLGTAIPSMINLAVVPLVNSVDTFWVGRLGSALALAGQAAANQAFFTLYFLVSYLPTITAPLVATAVGSGNKEEAQQRVCESLFVSTLLGLIGTAVLVALPRLSLRMLLPADAPAMAFAAPYLRVRAASMVLALVSATGFAAFRGMLDTVTPLKISLATNLLNVILDPLLIRPMGFVGAAVATAASEAFSGFTYLRLLLKRGLAKMSLLVKPPKWSSLQPLLQGGLSMLGRQAALNFAILSSARRAQLMDPTGVSAAAYGIVMQLYAVGIVIHVALQSTAATLVPATLSAKGPNAARRVADRVLVWSSLVGILLGVGQFLALPWLVPVFSTLPEVQQAVRLPALLVSILHVINGPVFAGEGTMLGLGCYRGLMLSTAASMTALVGLVNFTPLGQHLYGLMFAKMAFSSVQALAVVGHFLQIGPLSRRRKSSQQTRRLLPAI